MGNSHQKLVAVGTHGHVKGVDPRTGDDRWETSLPGTGYGAKSLGEELGIFGVFALLALYLLLVSRGFRVGFTGTEDFGRLLSSGLAFVLAL